MALYFAPDEVSNPTGKFFAQYGALGVDLFFVVSGLVIYMSSTARDVSPLQFAYRRGIRVVPAYWLFTAIAAILLLIDPAFLPATQFTPELLIKSLLFLPMQNPTGSGPFPLLTVGWTLNCEMFFYCLFAISLFLPGKARLFDRTVSQHRELLTALLADLPVEAAQNIADELAGALEEVSHGKREAISSVRGWVNQPMGCRPLPGAIENPVRGDTNHTYTPSISSRAARFPSHRNRVGPLSERHAKSMSDKGGLGLFQTQQRHAETCRGVAETARAPHPSGVGLHSRPGVV
ncbi:hypothetical protein LMG18091_04341 [Ralstonia wenshanensis]|uniref:Acyltransferase 3 domain-containing protein n=2 Tax=Ralstonia wenshanensis TaxID=2842456 RepID=A0AAD2B7I5_9RALS|nr:hypothetical protein LMG18091_04341 [Ralstonia wenshanensis]